MKKVTKYLLDNTAIIGLIFIIIVGALANPAFLRIENISNLLRSASLVGIIAVGMTFVILCGSIDLSVGSVFALAGYFFIKFGQTSPVLALLVPLVIGFLLGSLNGVLVTKMRIPAFIGTLATMMFARSLVLIFSKEVTTTARNLPSFLKLIGRGKVFGIIPMPFVILVILVLISSYLLAKFPFGRALYIVGGNMDAATMMGVSVQKTLFSAHVISSVLAAFGGIVFASRVGSAQPLAGTGYEMYAIASVVIGGAQLSGGVGKISGSFLGAIIMGSFTNIFSMQHLMNAVWQNAVIGLILLAIIILQSTFLNSLFNKNIVRGKSE
ncbi:ABC transporter permease [uncultured Sphaerochaeta sp.]|uniref:ABC transporter permease n=1 Tax=uncultured Sphaerochaeta sp. TaxID=886478 RepID=UPI002A0A7EA9|nr:ABC transporter permease [uncultured Sphaerochaeta sp.]